MKPSVLMLSAERPYPLHGGGAYRTASLLHYFAQFSDIDLILLAEDSLPAPVPEGLLRSQQVIQLPKHSKTLLARYRRNARRALFGVPPLIDRLAGLEQQIEEAIGQRRYDLGIVEHFWCAPYLPVLAAHCRETVLDLHNVESVLHRSCAQIDQPLISLGQLRFAAVSEKLEKHWLPLYSNILVASALDEARVKQIAPAACVTVYPNALPWVESPQASQPQVTQPPNIVFAANFEYHPNVDAVNYLVKEIWPKIQVSLRETHPGIRLRLVGRGDRFVRYLTAGSTNVEFTGAIPDTFSEVAAATVVVAPLRAGSGTRIKILEAWAANRAVVATSLAAEGLDRGIAPNLLLADNAADFAEAVCRCIRDPRLSTRLANAGRTTFEKVYSWPQVWKNLLIYNTLATVNSGRGYTGLI